uniref:Uncharacterized protein n=1 Tax=viral metagenome TaxID=1070528 RepID=A0A6C0BMS4_9ZZZZ
MSLPQELLFESAMYGEAHPDLSAQYIVDAMKSIDPNFNWSFPLIVEYVMTNNQICKTVRDRMMENCDANLKISLNLGTITVLDLDNNCELISGDNVLRGHVYIDGILTYMYPSIISREYLHVWEDRGISTLKRRGNEDLPTILPELFTTVPSNVDIVETLKSMNANFGVIFTSAQAILLRHKYMNHQSNLIRYLAQSVINGDCVNIDVRGSRLYINTRTYGVIGDLRQMLSQSFDIPDELIDYDPQEDGIDCLIVSDLTEKEREYYRNVSSDLLKIINLNA